MKKDPQELIARIRKDPYLSREEKSQLIESLRKTKRYGLVWEEKREEVEERQRDRIPVLTEVKERAIVSDAADAPNHILIEGDNLDALVALTYTHEGKIDVIYIDPPYNTGNKDFIYNDCFVDKESPYRHSLWLSFMSRRLKIAKRLLSDKGSIFISIDDNEHSQLKLLCDEIFGGNRFVASIPRLAKKQRSAQESHVDVSHDYIVCYSYSDSFSHNILRDIDESKVRFDKIGEYIEGDTKAILADKSKGYSLGGDYDFEYNGKIYQPIDKNGIRNRWLWTKERMEAAARLGILVETSSSLRMQLYLNKRFDDQTNTMVDRSSNLIFHTSDFMSEAKYSNATGSNELKGLEYELFRKFNNPKPLSLVRDIITFYSDKEITILDFFAGSGTTLHATMALNAEDGGHRQCILVTNNENRICEEVTYVRNKKVIEGYVNAKGETVKGLTANSLRYYRADFIDREKTAQNRRSLAAASADLICIREGSYNELKTFGKLKLKSSVARHFEGGGRHILLILNENAIEYFVKEIKDADSPDKFKVYVFSPGDYAYDDEFIDVADRVELCAVPSSIYNAYEKVLPKRVCDAGDEESGDGDIAEFDGGSGDELPGNVGNAMGAVRKSRSGMKMMWRNSLC